jgi:hypothetical protein
MKKPLLLLCCLFPCWMSAQTLYQDCIIAYEVCDFSTHSFALSEGSGQIMEALPEGICLPPLFSDFNSTWVRWAIESEGDLTFVITPAGDTLDIDFVVFKLLGDAPCENWEVVRCMASGENVGGPTDLTCLGPTGLAEGETDVSEEPGCLDGSNNFLAPLPVMPGEEYVIYIANSSGEGGFDLNFEGTFTFSCVDVATQSPALAATDMTLFPNPGHGPELWVAIDKIPTTDDLQFQIWNARGQQLYQQDFLPSDRMEPFRLPVDHLIPGVYTLVLQTKEGRMSRRFVRL